ncbi:unnamed protein product [Penicillium salamii]|nr:unnamed protein product [Penicillium salamii]CAG8406554.1 unnamed protein product [Penicillium salamii]
MCGDTNRPSLGGTIAVLFPQNQNTSAEASLSSSPESVSSFTSSSSIASMSSYNLFFRDAQKANRTKVVLQTNDTETYHALRDYGHLNIRIEKYGDISNTSQSLSPLHQFKLSMDQDTCSSRTEMEFELPEKLDLGVSETGVIGRQVTVREGGLILGIGVVGYN